MAETAPDARTAAEEALASIDALCTECAGRLYRQRIRSDFEVWKRVYEVTRDAVVAFRALLSAPQETHEPSRIPCQLPPAVREAAEKVKRHYPLNDPDEPLTPFGEDVKALLSALDSNGGA